MVSMNIQFLVIVMMMITAITIITIVIVIIIVIIIIIRIAEQAVKGRQMDLLVIYKSLDEVLAAPLFCHQ